MENKRKLSVFLILLLVILVLACGIYGYTAGEEYDLINALWYTIKLFFGDAGPYSNNLFVNIAKFSALIISASFVASLFSKVSEGVSDYFKRRKGNSVFVYGDTSYSKEFVNTAKSPVINRDELKKAAKYVLLSDNEDNMRFYNDNYDLLKDQTVYIKNADHSNTIIRTHHFFSLEQIAARKYWRENSLVDYAFKEGRQPKEELDITIVGNTPLSEQILFESIVTNIYAPDQKVTHHLFGNWELFKKTHVNCDTLGIKFYDSDCLDHLDVLERSAVVLFFEEEKDLNGLLNVMPKGNIVFFTTNKVEESLYQELKYGRNASVRVSSYYYLEGVCSEEEIINETSILDAKRLNYNYYVKNIKGTDTMNEQWNKLSSFHKMSNLACIDYYNFTTVRLLEKLTGKDYKDINDAEFKKHTDLLSELEHIRWCRFHHFCNWTYAKETDKNNKKHAGLIPYAELSAEEQYKDTVQLEEIRSMINQNGADI